MTTVIDASLVASALVDSGPDGTWAADVLADGGLAAPHLLLVEVASVLRRSTARGDVSQDVGSLAHHDLLDLRMELFPYAPFADRVWELRANVAPYDAWYVALAEHLDGPLATLDGRLRRAPGIRCQLLGPPGT